MACRDSLFGSVGVVAEVTDVVLGIVLEGRFRARGRSRRSRVCGRREMRCLGQETRVTVDLSQSGVRAGSRRARGCLCHRQGSGESRDRRAD